MLTIHGYLKEVAVSDIAEYEQRLYDYLDANVHRLLDVMETIRHHRRLSETGDRRNTLKQGTGRLHGGSSSKKHKLQRRCRRWPVP